MVIWFSKQLSSAPQLLVGQYRVVPFLQGITISSHKKEMYRKLHLKGEVSPFQDRWPQGHWKGRCRVVLHQSQLYCLQRTNFNTSQLVHSFKFLFTIIKDGRCCLSRMPSDPVTGSRGEDINEFLQNLLWEIISVAEKMHCLPENVRTKSDKMLVQPFEVGSHTPWILKQGKLTYGVTTYLFLKGQSNSWGALM